MTQKSPGDGKFPTPTVIGPGGSTTDLPDDDDSATKFRVLAVFRASIRQSRIQVSGDLSLTFSVPYEWKYEALPVTDIRGVQFLIQVLEPVMGGEDNGDGGQVRSKDTQLREHSQGTEGGQDGGRVADVLDISEWLTADPDSLPGNGQE